MMLKNKDKKGILLMIFASIAIALGQFFWKLAEGENIFWILSGFIVYTNGALAMILAFKYGELSVLHPMMAFGYVFAYALSIFVLGESWNYRQLIGVVLIISAIIILGRTKKDKNV